MAYYQVEAIVGKLSRVCAELRKLSEPIRQSIRFGIGWRSDFLGFPYGWFWVIAEVTTGRISESITKPRMMHANNSTDGKRNTLKNRSVRSPSRLAIYLRSSSVKAYRSP